jgi:hypothetical protein
VPTVSRAEQLMCFLKHRASLGTYSGHGTPADRAYLRNCSVVTTGGDSLTYSHDSGMHSSGWWKNPDYEHCLHLSICYRDPESGLHTGHQDRKRSNAWCELFYQGMTQLIWAEPPFSDDGKRLAVWHYRVFTDATFMVPLLPRGEVYSKQFTELGWQSWSDVHAEKQESAHT